MAFNSNDKRFSGQGTVARNSLDSPGPGAYIEVLADESAQKSGTKKPFGSGLDRFKKQRVTDVPGPGQYKPDISQKLLDRKNLTDGTAVFKNKAKRKLIDTQSDEDVPGVGQYSPERYN